MSSRIHTLVLAFLVGITLTTSVDAPARAEDDDGMAALLPYLDVETTATLAKLAENAGTLRQALGALSEAVDEQDVAEAGKALLELATSLGVLDDDLLKALGIERKWVEMIQGVTEALKDIKEAGNEFEEIEPEEVERLAVDLALEILDERTGGVVPGRLLDLLEAAKDPIALVQTFLEGAFKTYLGEKPVPLGTTGIVARILMEEGVQASLFSPNPGLTIELTYAGSITLKAKGLYFEYAKGKPPTPNVSKLKLEGDIVGDALRTGVRALGELIPENLGLGIRVKDPEFLGGAAAGEKKLPCGLRCDLAVTLHSSLPEVELNGVTLYANKGLTVDVEELAFTLPGGAAEIPVYPGFSISGFGGSYNFHTRTFSVSTWLHTSGLKPETSWGVLLVLTPGQGKVRLEGCLMIAKQPLAHGEVTISSEGIFAKADILNLGEKKGSKDWVGVLPEKLLDGTLDFQLTLEGLSGKVSGSMLWGMASAELEVDLGMDGTGTISAKSQRSVGLGDVSGWVEIGIEKYFKKLELEAGFAIGPLDLGIRKVDAALSASGTFILGGKPQEIHVGVSACGCDPLTLVDIEWLDDIDEGDIIRALAEGVLEIIEKILQEVVKFLERIYGKLEEAFKHWEEQFRKTIVHHRKLLEKKGGQLSKVYKSIPSVDEMTTDPGGTVARVWEDTLREVSKAPEVIVDIAKNPKKYVKVPSPAQIGTELVNGVDILVDVLIPGGGGGSSGPSIKDQMRMELLQAFSRGLTETAGPTCRILEVLAKIGRKQWSRRSVEVGDELHDIEVRVWIKDAAWATKDYDKGAYVADGVITVVAEVYARDVVRKKGSRTPIRKTHSTQVITALVEIADAAPDLSSAMNLINSEWEDQIRLQEELMSMSGSGDEDFPDL